LENFEFIGAGIIAGDVASVHGMVGSTKVVDDNESIKMFGVDEFTVFTGFEVENEEDGVFSGAGAMIGTGGDVGNATGLVWGDAVDALVGNGDGIDFGFPSLGVIDHGVAAGVVFAFFGLGRIALFGAEVDATCEFAGVVTGVDLGLSAEAFEVDADLFVGVDDDVHLLGRWIEFDQPGVDGVGMCAYVEATVVPFNDGEITFAICSGFLGDDMGFGRNPFGGKFLSEE